MNWDFSPVWQYADVLAYGLGMTFVVTLISSVVGLSLGIVISLLLSSRNLPTARFVTAATEFIRACPPIALLLWVYFGLPGLTNIAPSSFMTAVIVFSIYYAAFAGDILRSSIAAIPPGAVRSFAALGMSKHQVIRRFIVPDTIRRSFGALNALTVSNLKMSSLASVIALQELTYSATLILTQRPRPFEIYTAMALGYIVVIIPIVAALRSAERSKYFSYAPTSSNQR
jgi:polar amino acid transport system permease protein